MGAEEGKMGEEVDGWRGERGGEIGLGFSAPERLGEKG